MRKFAVLFLLFTGISFLFLPLACKKQQPSPTPRITAAPTAAPVVAPTPERTASPSPVRTSAAPTSSATPSRTVAPSPSVSPTQRPTVAPLTLTIDSPAAESTVKERTIAVRGKSNPDAVVTVGSSNVDVDENGNFSASVTLVEGVNVIEVLASDLSGSSKGQVLTVIYAP